MLKKLIKHEFKATRRFFLPAYAVFAALLLVTRLSLLAIPALDKAEGILASVASMTMGLVTAATAIGLIALLIAPVIFNIIRFYRNMLGDEGYLTFTLPATTGQLIRSKLLSAVFWEALTGIAVILFGGLFLVTLDFEVTKAFFSELSQILGMLWDTVGAWSIVLMVLCVIALVIQMFANMLAFYTAMSIGQCADKHRLLISAAAYVGINFATSWLVQIPMTILAVTGEMWVDKFNAFLTDLLSNSQYVAFCQILAVILLIAIAATLLLAAAHYFLTRYFLTKQLNLA